MTSNESKVFEGFFVETDGRFLVYCENCKTKTGRPMTVSEVAGLCGMADITCDVCGRKEGEPNTPLAMKKSFEARARQTAEKRRQLEEQVKQLAKDEGADREAFIAEMVSKGWKKFEFFSSYYGSHSEYGEDDTRTTYLFHPEVDLARWEGVSFAHGHHGQNESNDAFEAWLESLKDDQYVEI